MTDEGYPDKEELEKIEKWPLRDVFGLVEFIDDLWQYKFMNKGWAKGVFHYELHTGGWSGNESVIEALEKNRFVDRFCEKWLRGGHFYFEIHPESIGFRSVAEFAKSKGVSRQMIHKNKEKYDWLKIGERNLMVRDKK